MNILYSESNDLSIAESIITLTLSTPLFEAPSTSIGSPLPLLILLANILANVVFPVPEGPWNM